MQKWKGMFAKLFIRCAAEKNIQITCM